MAMLLQQIRRATFPRRGTTALTAPHAFSRFCSTNGVLGLEKEETFAGFLGKFVLKYGLTLSFMYGTFYWVDYGGYRTTIAEWEKLDAEMKKEWKAYYEVKKQLDDLRGKDHPL